jgi:hypothetical protein
MGIEPPPNIMTPHVRPAKVRTGAKTATKNQERDYLEKFGRLADDPMLLVPEWLGDEGKNPFKRLFWKLEKVQARRESERRLRWGARGRHLWNGYAATLLVLKGGKIPSFASFKFRGRDVKFVYRTGTHRNALIGVQHHDDPEVRLMGYIEFAKKKGAILLSGEDRFVAVPAGRAAPTDVLSELLDSKNVKVDDAFRCAHAEGDTWRFVYDVPDLKWACELCLDCVGKVGGAFADLLDGRILGPEPKIRVEPSMKGLPFTIKPETQREAAETIGATAFEKAHANAKENYLAYSDLELAQWTREEWLKVLNGRPEGFLLVGDELWLADFTQAAAAFADTEMERRALTLSFEKEPPRMRVSDKSLHKILDPGWKKHGKTILGELAGGLLNEEELAGMERLNPSEALTMLARVLSARERFKDFLQFESLDPRLEFVMTCLQMQRSGEQRILAEKLHAGARDDVLRSLTLAIARGLGEQTNLEWQYAPHEKDAASFLEPYVREVLNANPTNLTEAMGKLATVVGAPAPKPKPRPVAA